MSFYKNGYSVNIRLSKNSFLKLKQQSKEEERSMSAIMRRAWEKEQRANGRAKRKKTAN